MNTRRIAVIAAACAIAMTLALSARAAQVGIKYNRPKREYPEAVLRDFQRFSRDRISAIMICLPWTQWEPAEGQIDKDFVAKGLAPVLDFCATNKMTVVISNHCSFWGQKGNWSVPKWLQAKPGFKTASSCLDSAPIRHCHISFLNRLIEATRGFPTVTGYNLLNEPVAASEYSVKKNNAEFQARWEGVIEICEAVRKHAGEIGLKQALFIGNAGGDAAYASYSWKNTGKFDLEPLWTKTLDKVAAQGVTALQESAKFHPNRPRVRTEGFLNFAILGAARDTEDFVNTKTKWSATNDHAAAVYDYDNVYDYEGLGNASVPNLEAFYSWRVGSPSGSANMLSFLDHRHNDRPTPYYWAMRDLASGVDSFETLAREGLPKNGEQTRAFDPAKAKPGVSKHWKGSGKIEGEKDDLPPGVESNAAARVTLAPKQFIERQVVSAHWRDSGVRASDSFVFYGRAQKGGNVALVVKTPDKALRGAVKVDSEKWTRYSVPLAALGIEDSAIPAIQSVGLENPGDSERVFLIDEFLIRQPVAQRDRLPACPTTGFLHRTTAIPVKKGVHGLSRICAKERQAPSGV